MLWSRVLRIAIYPVMFTLFAGLGCATMPVVKPNCVISWDRSADWRINYYQVSVWKVGESMKQSTHRVDPSVTQSACQDLGVTSEGKWQVSVRACLKDDVCSDSSDPVTFKFVSR